jgi:hypothetical protein
MSALVRDLEHASKLASDRQGLTRDLWKLVVDAHEQVGERWEIRLDEFEEERCEGFVRREPLAERL